MAISVIYPLYKEINLFKTSCSIILNQLSKDDQLIIVNFHGSNTDIDDDFFPRNIKVIYYEQKNTEIKAINDAILTFVVNNHILIIDPSSLPSETFIKDIKNDISDNRIIFPTINKTSCIREKNIILKSNTFLFPLEQAFKCGLFNEKFEGYRSSSPYLTFFNKMKNKNVTFFQSHANITLQKNQELTMKEKEIFDRNKQYTNRIVSKILKTPATIIVPNSQQIPLNILNKNDEIINLSGNKSSLAKDLYKNIRNANNECVILLNNSNLNYKFKYNFICMFKRFYNPKVVFIDNIGTIDNVISYSDLLTRVSTSKVNENTSICFDKNIINGLTPQNPRDDFQIILKNLLMRIDKGIYLINPMSSFLKKDNSTFVISGIGQSKEKIVNSANKRFKQKRKRGRIPKKVSKSSILFGMKWKNINEIPKPNIALNKRPKIVLLCDVQGWAWWIKSQYLYKYLSEYYDISIANLIGPNKTQIDSANYDLYFTFGHSFIDRINTVASNKRITGVTAHRPRSQLEPQMKKAAVIHANSMLLYNEVKKFHNIVFYLPNGVDENLFRIVTPLESKKGPFVVGHVGKLSPRKGQHEYIFPAVERTKVKGLYHLNNHTNKIPHKKMFEIYQKMDIFIVASQEDGTPNPALEAAACGRPIISNKIGNMPELINEYNCGILVDKSIESYVDAINWCMNNREKVFEMGKNARRAIEKKWNWKVKCLNFLYMWDAILGIKRDPSVYEGVDEINFRDNPIK